MSIRQKELEGALPTHRIKSGETAQIVINATGLKVFGEGEWKVHEHGYFCCRTWRKLHIAVEANSQEIKVAIVSTNNFKDKERLTDCVKVLKGILLKLVQIDMSVTRIFTVYQSVE